MRKQAWLLVGSGIVLGAVVTWLLVRPSPGESFPVVFRGTTQGVSGDGDAVAFHPIREYREIFDAFPAFEITGENRTYAVPGEVCLAPGTTEQDVVFAVVDTGTYSLAWYACLTAGVLRG